MMRAKAPEVLVTSGGTVCPIDDVRVVTNLGTGLFGSELAEAFLGRGCRVHYLHSSGARLPFLRLAQVDLDGDLERELSRVRGVHAEYVRCRDRLERVAAPTFDDYAREAKRLVTERPIRIAVMVMAVSDYAPVRRSGKLSSDAQTWTLEMARCEKVIASLRALRSDLFVVGFKLSSGLGPEEMRRRAHEWLSRGGYDLVVANDLGGRRLPEREVSLIDRAGAVRPFAGTGVAGPLADAILEALRAPAGAGRGAP